MEKDKELHMLEEFIEFMQTEMRDRVSLKIHGMVIEDIKHFAFQDHYKSFDGYVYKLIDHLKMSSTVMLGLSKFVQAQMKRRATYLDHGWRQFVMWRSHKGGSL